jgi:hypothetical protein
LPGPHDENSILSASSSDGESPTIAPTSDAVRQRVVNRRVTERAGDADAGQLSVIIHLPLHADDSVEFQQRDRRGWIHQKIVGVGANRVDHFRRQRFDIDLESDTERGDRIDCRDHLVHAKHGGPQLLIAERVEAKNLASLA